MLVKMYFISYIVFLVNSHDVMVSKQNLISDWSSCRKFQKKNSLFEIQKYHGFKQHDQNKLFGYHFSYVKLKKKYNIFQIFTCTCGCTGNFTCSLKVLINVLPQ